MRASTQHTKIHRIKVISVFSTFTTFKNFPSNQFWVHIKFIRRNLNLCSNFQNINFIYEISIKVDNTDKYWRLATKNAYKSQNHIWKICQLTPYEVSDHLGRLLTINNEPSSFGKSISRNFSPFLDPLLLVFGLCPLFHPTCFAVIPFPVPV